MIDPFRIIEYHLLRYEYRFSEENNMASSDKVELFSRIHELRSQEGKGWKEIANILEKEGYEENGKVLSDNALRKRYAKWKKSETRGTSLVASEPELEQEPEGSGFDQSQKGQMERHGEQFEDAALPAASENAIAAGIASLIALNNQLLGQVQQSHRVIERLEKRLEEREHKTSHTEHAEEQPVTSRELLELIREITPRREQQMEHIEEKKQYRMSREDVQQWIEESVQDRVDSELKTMLSEGGSFPTALIRLVDQRLNSLFSRGEPVAQTPHAGPGRGKRGKTHKKFSASLEESLFIRVKSLPGQFSGHLSNALEAYLAVVEEKQD